MRYEWDEDKNRGNIAKHKVSFDTAIAVFDDPHELSIVDRIVKGEERWQTLGMIAGILLIVAHTWREEGGDEVIRVISARKANAIERRAYAKNLQRSR
ncbi:MAG TPA: BrnT family toxin [Bryobacteraceae bacterium]|nr:BrnT family toxin [Bryobacteraceae bacterium]